MMMHETSTELHQHGAWARAGVGAWRLLWGTVLLGARAVALVAYILLSMAEPFIGVVLCALAFGAFATAVLFGFILQAPFEHRWTVLAASVVLMLAYWVYLSVIRLLQRFINGH